MKICVSFLPLVVGVILQFDVSTSETPPSSPRSPPTTQETPLKLIWSGWTGKILAVELGEYIYPMKDMKLTQEVQGIVLGSWLYRGGYVRRYIAKLTKEGFINTRAPKWANRINKFIKNDYIQPRPGDVVFDTTGRAPIGVYSKNKGGKLILYHFNLTGVKQKKMRNKSQ